MPDPDELEGRVGRLEQEVARLRERAAAGGADAAAARLLAGGADRDVSEVRAELRALTRLLHALRETQIEHGARITSLERRVGVLEEVVREGFAEMRAGFAEMHAEFARIRAGFAEMRTGMTQIVGLLERPG